jgi:radical SAM superfamily enzyme with C-terminal helix-hairpin-helix motif
MATFETNHRWLMAMVGQDLLVKRINIRRVAAFPGTLMHARPAAIPEKTRNRFEYYRERIRRDVDIPMLRTIYPLGTVLTGVRMLERRPGHSLGKQVASYSITVKISGECALKSFHDAVITGHRERSLTGLSLPIRINDLPREALESIPGIGGARASNIILARPFHDRASAAAALTGVDERITRHVAVEG